MDNLFFAWVPLILFLVSTMSYSDGESKGETLVSSRASEAGSVTGKRLRDEGEGEGLKTLYMPRNQLGGPDGVYRCTAAGTNSGFYTAPLPKDVFLYGDGYFRRLGDKLTYIVDADDMEVMFEPKAKPTGKNLNVAFVATEPLMHALRLLQGVAHDMLKDKGHTIRLPLRHLQDGRSVVNVNLKPQLEGQDRLRWQTTHRVRLLPWVYAFQDKQGVWVTGVSLKLCGFHRDGSVNLLKPKRV